MSVTFTPRLPASTPNLDSFWGEGEFGPLVSLNYGDAITLAYLLRDEDTITSARHGGGLSGIGTVADLTMRAYRAKDWLLGVERQFRGGRGVVPSFGVRVPINQFPESDETHKVEVDYARELLERLFDLLRQCRDAGVGQVWWS